MPNIDLFNRADGAIGNSWNDVQGGVFTIDSNRCRAAASAADAYLRNHLIRPQSEDAPTLGAKVTFAAESFISAGAICRYQRDTKHFYMATCSSANGGSMYLFRAESGLTEIARAAFTTPFDPTRQYRVEIVPSAPRNGITTLNAKVTDLTTSTAVAELKGVVDTTPELQNTGGVGLVAWNSSQQLFASFESFLAPIIALAPVKIVFVGDSRTYGYSASTGQGSLSGTVFPARVMAPLGASCEGVNLGVSGKTAQQIRADAPAQSAAHYDSNRVKNIAIILAGLNDMFFNNRSAQQAFDDVQATASIYKAAGYDQVFVSTELPASYPSQPNPSYLTTNRPAFNALMRGEWEDFADGLIDFAANAQIGDDDDSQNPNYFATDETHLLDAGEQVMADVAVPQILPVLPDLTAPSAPTLALINNSNSFATVSVAQSPSSDAEKIQLQLDGDDYQAPFPLAPSVTTTRIINAANGTTHSVTAIALDGAGNPSAPSNAVTIAPVAPPTPPPTSPPMSTRPASKGETPFKGQFLQLVTESVPGFYDPNGERFLLTCLTGDFQPDEAWDSFRPDGVNEDAWHALSREHRIYTASIAWDYQQQLTLARMLFGEGALTAVQPAGTVEQIFALGASDARPIKTFTLEWGTPNGCERCPYGLLTTISRGHDRDGAGKVDGQLTLLCRKPIAVDAPMTGGLVQNAALSLAAANVTGDGVFTLTKAGSAGQNVTFSPGDTTGQTVAKLAAVGITATVTGTVAVAPGEVHTLTATGTNSPATIYGVISIGADTGSGELQSAVRALGGVYANVVVTRINTTGTSDNGIFLIAFPVGVGDVPDITATPGVGWTSSVTPAGSSVGAIAIAVTAPANTGVTISKVPGTGNGWSGAVTQAGGNGKTSIPKRLPILNQHFGVRISDTRAGLGTAPLVARTKMAGWSLGALAEPVWFASEGETTFQSHTDDPEGRKTAFTLRLGASSPLVAILATYKAESPSRPFWIEVRSTYGDGLHLDKWQGYVSVSEAKKRVAAGKILAWDYTLMTVLDSQPFNADAVADGGASFYAILRKAA